ncbi:MAG: phosphotransferase family protein [Streptosporangiaceae bacterium]
MTVNTDIAGRLIAVLRNAAGPPGLEYERRPEPMRGGFWAELFSFSLANPPDGWPAELVARLMPYPGSARKETIVQRAVAAAGFPTPFVRAAGGPDDGLGLAFMVMDRAPGGPALSGLDGLSLAAVPRLLRQIPDLLATSMVRLHALDPGLVRGELEQVRDAPVTVPGLLAALARFAGEFGRTDLVDVAHWLTDHPPEPSPDVICHGDLHPFNLLADGDRVTVLDWSTALLAPRAHDVGFTSLQLSEPALRVPGWQRPLVRMLGRVLARRFVRAYLRQAGVTIGPGEQSWHQAVVCLRALTEVASWVHQGTDEAHAGHPWLINGPVFARRLARLTGAPVRAR